MVGWRSFGGHTHNGQRFINSSFYHRFVKICGWENVKKLWGVGHLTEIGLVYKFGVKQFQAH